MKVKLAESMYWFWRAPEIVVKIASKSTRKCDETIKRRLYEQPGVLEYWVVDRARHVIRVYRLDGGRFGRPAQLSREAGDVLRTPHLDRLEIPLERVFQD